MFSKKIDITVAVTAHGEGFLLHKTLLSIDRAINYRNNNLNIEVIIHLDSPTASTIRYIESGNNPISSSRTIFSNFKDLSKSRNRLIKESSGKYLAFIDGDDLMSENWLFQAFKHLEKFEYGKYVAHSEVTIEFGNDGSYVAKHPSISKDIDTLLSAQSNRWNSVIFAPAVIFDDIKYIPKEKGYGYEDWTFNNQTIYAGKINVLVPETIIYVRKNRANSMFVAEQSNNFILPASKLLSFENIRNLKIHKTLQQDNNIKPYLRKIKNKTASIIFNSIPLSLTVYKLLKKKKFNIPEWAIDSMNNMHKIENNIMIYDDFKNNFKYYDSIPKDAYETGLLYKQIVDKTNRNSYDYLIFVPWIKTGGADKYLINYVKGLLNLSDFKICLITTEKDVSEWQSKLTSVDIIPFGLITAGISKQAKYKIMEHFIENSSAKYIHIINSQFAYEFIEEHKIYFENDNKKIIASAFSKSVNSYGKIYGYSQTHLPKIYEMLSYIVTDNDAVCNEWTKEYGFEKNKMMVLYQNVDVNKNKLIDITNKKKYKILWAARVCDEKIPEIVFEIARNLEESKFDIHMYGELDESHVNFFRNRSRPRNVKYMGKYDGFESINYCDYDIFLYTSLFDGMPNVLLEAGSHGMPIISSGVGGVKELLKDNGIIIDNYLDPKSYSLAIRDLASDVEKRRKISNNIVSKILKDFNNTKYDNKVSHLLKDLNGVKG